MLDVSVQVGLPRMVNRRTSDDRRATTREGPDRRIEDAFYTVEELAIRWKCHRRYVYKLIEARVLRAVKIGPRAVRVEHDERERYEESNRLTT